MQWYYSKNGTQLGPIGTGEIQSKIASGEVSAADLVWKDGMADWLPASQVAELRPLPTAPAVQESRPESNTPYQAPAVAQPSSQPPGAPLAPGAPVSQGLAVASMVCGIIAILTCCVWCLSGPLAVAAVVLGHVSLSKIRLEPGRHGGKGMAKSGLVTGYLALLLCVCVAILSLWLQTLTPEKLEQMEFLPKEVRDEIRKQQDLKNQRIHEAETPGQ